MDDINFAWMQEEQRELQEQYKDKWSGLSPDAGCRYLLWMFAEAGEAADIIKKKGSEQIMSNPEVRKHFIEELCDVMMYFNDVMLCYSITPEELAEEYQKKHEKNMKRW